VDFGKGAVVIGPDGKRSRPHLFRIVLSCSRKHSGEYLFEIIMRRYQVRSTMMTSNRPLEDWGKLIGDVPAATAILDRFLHNAEVIAITGRSYRLRNRAAGEDHAAGEKTKGSRRAGSNESHSPPEDTNASVAVSSVGGDQPAET
jgi:hypothetical protein